jgi:hypothetical protein
MRVFLSHAAEDRALVERLAQELRDRNVETIVDPTSLHAGSNWLEELTDEVGKADAFIFLVGKASENDSYQRREWSSALRADWDAAKPMVPLVVGEAPLPAFLRDRVALHIDPDGLQISAVADEIIQAIKSPTANRDPSVHERVHEQYERIAHGLREFAATLED